MKFSAGKAARKWTFGLSGCDQRTIGAVLVLLLVAAPAQAYLTTSRVPLPKPRPAEAPAIKPAQKPGEEPARSEQPAEPEKPAAEARPPEPPPPSACRLALTDAIAVAPSIPDIKGPGACGGPDMVRLEAVVLPDKTRVPLKPAGTMRCAMATAVAEWIRADMAPLATNLGTKLLELDNFDSFDCRGRNRVVGAKLSEHGRANALDVRGLKLANGRSIALTERNTPREQREAVLHSVCTRFTTVLGPGSDGYHEDHIHLDIAERRGNYRICQWDVWDEWPRIAPLMPAVRPDEAPPREVAEGKPGEKTPEAAKPAEPAAAQPAAEAEPEPEAEAAPPQEQPTPKPKPKPKKRRAPPPSPFSFLR
ncbi:extensin family protein [Tardiphaga sp. 804_B3_N1_9]|uniref:extensin family protein n=1 Tax=Tardiphaga TaxID=1395974 RepID=UPI00158634A1|nr:extensin family protein [Tardiphaga robiniae]